MSVGLKQNIAGTLDPYGDVDSKCLFVLFPEIYSGKGA
jgi:hypothetical protein